MTTTRFTEERTNAPQPDIMFGPHVVAFVDLVGQSQKLMQWDYSPDESSFPHFLESESRLAVGESRKVRPR